MIPKCSRCERDVTEDIFTYRRDADSEPRTLHAHCVVLDGFNRMADAEGVADARVALDCVNLAVAEISTELGLGPEFGEGEIVRL